MRRAAAGGRGTQTGRTRIAAATVLALAIAIAGCAGTAGPAATLQSIDPNSPALTAHDSAFDRTELDVPAGRPFSLVLYNKDGSPHNVAIYSDDSLAQRLFAGDIVQGPATHVYDVSSLPAGTWYFRCDVHPAMHGQLVARP